MQDEDRANKKLCLCCEYSFNAIVTKFGHSDYSQKHRIFQNGVSNWEYICELWDLQVLFYNLFTCTQNHGSQVTGILGVEPLMVKEYLFSANHDLLIPIPGVDVGDNLNNKNLGGHNVHQDFYPM